MAEDSKTASKQPSDGQEAKKKPPPPPAGGPLYVTKRSF